MLEDTDLIKNTSVYGDVVISIKSELNLAQIRSWDFELTPFG
jgi:hypothetical protein